MTTLRIEHPITDFGIWRAAFGRFQAARTEGAVLAARIYRPVDDEKYVLIDLDFATDGQAEQFHQFLRTRVWSTPDNAPGLAGTPMTRILHPETPPT